jgi:hypothetical protein
MVEEESEEEATIGVIRSNSSILLGVCSSELGIGEVVVK